MKRQLALASRGVAGAVLLAGTLTGPLVAQNSGRPSLAPAESALARRDFREAQRLADRYLDRRGSDARGWVVLGRAYLWRDSASRTDQLNAIRAFREATRLDPALLVGWDGLARAGLRAGGEDGQAVARGALEHLLTQDPRYPDAWSGWLVLYRNDDYRRAMRRRLTPHGADPVVAARIGRLFIEEEQYDSANAVLDRALELDSVGGSALALRAQSAFEAGDSTSGAVLYARALLNADRDEDGILWAQVVGIATAEEQRAWGRTRAADRGRFLAAFWARRDPDLFVDANARIAEHFRRLRSARRQFALTRPLAAYHRSSIGRGVDASTSVGEQMFYSRCEARWSPTAPVDVRDEAREFLDPEFGGFIWNPPYGPREFPEAIQPPGTLYSDPEFNRFLSIPRGRDLRDVDSVQVPIGYNVLSGLDDRGLTLLRFGEPRQRLIGSINVQDPFCRIPDLERWTYADIGTVRFLRPSALSVGPGAGSTQMVSDVVHRPMRMDQFEATVAALTRDESSVPAPLAFGTWTAQFPAAGRTELVVVTDRAEAAAALVGPAEDSVARGTSGTGVVQLRARPGMYTLLSQVRDSGQLGRMTIAVRLRGFGRPDQSDLLAAPRWEGVPTREAMLAQVRRDLVFRVGEVLRTYAELYGVEPDSSGRVRYQATYEVAEADAEGRVARQDTIRAVARFTFERDQAPAAGPVREWLDITPATLPRGRYLLRLETRDLATGRRIGRSQLGFVVR